MVSPRTPVAWGYIGRGMLCGGVRTRKAATAAVESLRDSALMTAIKVPPLGESIVEATVSRWLKKEGEAVAAGDTLVELETDKITVEVPALAAGVLSKRAAKEGDVVNVDELLGELDGGRARRRAAPALPRRRRAAGGSGAALPPAAAPQPQPRRAPRRGGAVKASPAAQRVAAEQGVDLAAVTGTGRGGVVSKPDVIEQAARAAALAAPQLRRRRRRAAPTAPAPAPAALRRRARRARDAREDDDAPQAHRREPAAVAELDGAR